MSNVVSDTGPLITLEKISDGFDFARLLTDTIIVPPSVLKEVSYYYESGEEYLDDHGIPDLVNVRPIPQLRNEIEGGERLHQGEKDAMQIALHFQVPLWIEEAEGRRIAEMNGITISGIAGQVLKAYRSDLISQPRALKILDEMVNARRIGDRLHRRLVQKMQ